MTSPNEMTRFEEPSYYYAWLRELVGGSAAQFDAFFNALHLIDYEYSIRDDQNRALDGKQLRRHFESSGAATLGVSPGPCTFLEFLIGLAKRMSDATYEPDNQNQIGFWFWEFVQNLGIDHTDTSYICLDNGKELKDAVERFTNREYAPDGSEGGLFPLRRAPGDTRIMSVWQQMQAFLMEYFE